MSQWSAANSEQLEAITAPVDAAVRVLAGPGSGKTFSVALRYVYLVEHGAKPENILAVTYNKKMAESLQARIAQAVGTLSQVAQRRICTIHAAGYRMLCAEGDKRRNAADWQISKSLQAIAESVWPDSDGRPAPAEIAYWIDRAKAAGATDAQFFVDHLGDWRGRLLHQARQLFDADMRRQGLITFPDMLLDVEQKLLGDAPLVNGETFREKWQARFQWIIVDEGQDVTAQAMRILTTLAAPQDRFFIAGDPDQLLYRWSGAAPEDNLLNGFERRYPNGLTVKLTTNYRSTRQIVQAQTALIRRNYRGFGGPYDGRYLKLLSPRPDAPGGKPVEFTMYATPEDEAQAVAQAVKQSIAEGWRPGDIFIGARTRSQLGYLEGLLVELGVPVINVCGGSFWQQRHIADVVAYVRLACHPDDSEAFQRVYNIASASFVHPWGAHRGEYCYHRYLGKKALGKVVFLETCGGSYLRVQEAVKAVLSFRPGVEDLTRFVGRFKSLIPEGPAAMVGCVVDGCYLRYLQATEGIASASETESSKLADLETLVDLAGEFENVTTFLKHVAQVSQLLDQRLDEQNAVVLSTIHRLKGLERPVVYGVGLCEGVTGRGDPTGLLPHTFSLRPPQGESVLPTGEMGRIEDERCVAFVLISRAKEECYLSGYASRARDTDASLFPSRFVAEMGL